MSEMGSNMTGKTVGAALIGAVAGLGLGLLFAPRSGRETRSQIQSKAQDTKQRVGDEVDNVKQKAQAGMDKIVSVKDTAVESAKAAGRKAKEEARKTREEAKGA